MTMVVSGDEMLERAMTLAAAGEDDVQPLLDLAAANRGAAHQARGRCLTALQARPSERRVLLQALELIDHALDRLDASRSG